MLLTVGVLLVVFLAATTWLGRSERVELALPPVGRVLIVSNAGPVELRNGQANTFVGNESWLFNRPVIETLADGDEVVVRVTCGGSMPCRSASTLTVTAGTEVVVVSTAGPVLVAKFGGDVTVYDGYGDTALGAVTGSVKVVSEKGGVFGSGLAVSRIDVSTVSSEVALDFLILPERVLVVTGPEATRLRLPEGEVSLSIDSPEELQNLEIDSTAGAPTEIVIRSEGPVSVTPPVNVQPKE